MLDKYKDLKLALLQALVKADELKDTEDGGTCNFDSPTFYWKGYQKKKVVEVLKSLDLRYFDYYPYCIVITGFTSGCGNRRSRMAEAFSKSMQDAGYQFSMYWQMD